MTHRHLLALGGFCIWGYILADVWAAEFVLMVGP